MTVPGPGRGAAARRDAGPRWRLSRPARAWTVTVTDRQNHVQGPVESGPGGTVLAVPLSSSTQLKPQAARIY